MKNSFNMIFILQICVISSFCYSQNNTWHTYGPKGGKVNSVEVHPFDDNIIYASVEYVLYKTINNGDDWIQIADNSMKIAIDKVDPNIVFNINYNGIYKSTNGGQNWLHIAFFETHDLYIDPLNSNKLYAGSNNGVLYISNNGGNTWNPSYTGSSWNITAIAVSPVDSNHIFAGTSGNWDYPGDGIYQTTDGGINWNNNSTSFLHSNITAIRINPQNSSILYAGTIGSGMYPGEGIIKSTNGGSSWFFSNDSLPNFSTIFDLEINPALPEILYLALFDGIYKSINSGQNWFLINTNIDAGHVQSISLFQSDPNILAVGTHQFGLLKSTNGGETLFLIGVISVRMLSIYVDPNNSDIIYTIGKGHFKSIDEGEIWDLINVGLGGGKIVTGDPINSNILYAGVYSPHGGVYKSLDSGSVWQLTPLQNVAINDIEVSFSNTDIIFAGGTEDPYVGGVFKSTDAGISWDTLSNQYFVISIAIDPINPDLVFLGTHLNGIIKSIDGGGSWFPVNTGLPLDIYIISDILINPVNSNEIYCTSTSHGVYKSIDGGNNWTSINNDLNILDTRTLAIDTLSNSLFVGTFGDGVFKSDNDGQNWTAINNGWQSTCVSDLVFVSYANYYSLYATNYFNNGIWKYNFTTNSIGNDNTDFINNYILYENYPNPFNPETSIKYNLPNTTDVKLSIFSLLGQKTKTLVNKRQTAGLYEITWNGRDERNQQVTSGVYLCQLQAGNFTQTNKLILIR